MLAYENILYAGEDTIVLMSVFILTLITNIMKVFKRLAFVICIAIGIGAFVSCEKQFEPTLLLNVDSMEISAEAGEYELTYNLNHPLEEAAEPKVIADVDWLTILSTKSGLIKFTADENKTIEKREALILIKYPTLMTLECKVIQGATQKPLIQVDLEQKTVSCQGGDNEFSVIIHNPVSGVKPVATFTASWATDFTFADNKLKFKVEESRESETRQAEITISYEGAESVGVNLIQEAANMTMLGNPANSYIVSTEGLYGFETKTNDGNPIEGIESADWLWTSKANNIVEGVTYFNGVISFKATGKTGNALIVALNKEKEIVWSWHIWATPQPKLLTYDNGTVIMDRFLGATSTGWEGVEPLGLLYQWGRKDPFWGANNAKENEEKDCTFNQAREMTTINPKFNMDWMYIGGRGKGTTIDESIKNPVCMWADESTSDYHWLAVSDKTLWAEQKTIYDPCPAGYRVSSSDELNVFSKENFKYDESKKAYAHQMGEKIDWWPISGVREDKSGLLVLWQTLFAWNCGNSELDNLFFIDYFGSRLVAGPNMLETNGLGNRCFAQPVRCVQIK